MFSQNGQHLKASEKRKVSSKNIHVLITQRKHLEPKTFRNDVFFTNKVDFASNLVNDSFPSLVHPCLTVLLNYVHASYLC